MSEVSKPAVTIKKLEQVEPNVIEATVCVNGFRPEKSHHPYDSSLPSLKHARLLSRYECGCKVP